MSLTQTLLMPHQLRLLAEAWPLSGAGRVGRGTVGGLCPAYPLPTPSMGHLSIHAPNMAEIPSATWPWAGWARPKDAGQDE